MVTCIIDHFDSCVFVANQFLSYDVAVIPWITSCHKSYDHTCINTFARTHNVIDNVQDNYAFSHSANVHFEGDKRSYGKQNLTLVIISYKIYETRRRLLS